MLLVIVGLSSCKKMIEVAPSPRLISSKAVFSNDKTVMSAVGDVYTSMLLATTLFSNNRMSFYCGLSADEIYNTASNTDYDAYAQNTLVRDHPSIQSSIWRPAYVALYKINLILEGLASSPNISAALNKQLTGEMKTLRAWYYFCLVNLFGDVPLILSSEYEVNAIMPRTASGKIYEQIIVDLKDAKNLLRTDYPSVGKARPNKWTATALLSRVYLFQEDWTNAALEASEVITSGAYQLVSDLNKVFLMNSEETLWEVPPPNGLLNTGIGGSYIPSSSTRVPTFAIRPSLLDAFEPNDLRKSAWINKNTVAGKTYYYPFKYKYRTTAAPLSEYNTMIRFDELYLIRAEARIHLEDLDGSRDDIDMIRLRASLSKTPAESKEELLKAVYTERRLELFTEWGHRWLDLKRTGQADLVLNEEKGSQWQSTDGLYPIPYSEILYNPFLTQNPGY